MSGGFCLSKILFLLFKDTFKLYQLVNGTQKEVPFDGKGIAWWTDYNIKYRNPSVSPLKNAFNGTNLRKCQLLEVIYAD